MRSEASEGQVCISMAVDPTLLMLLCHTTPRLPPHQHLSPICLFILTSLPAVLLLFLQAAIDFSYT